MAANTVRYALGGNANVIDIPDGQTPLTEQQIIDQYTPMGARDQAQYARLAFEQQFGRNPTAQELAQALPAFMGTDRNLPDQAGGNAYVSQMAQAFQNTPDKLYAKQQQKYLADAPQHYDEIKNLFQQNFGRAPSQEELDHFGSALASGTTDSYQLQKFMQQDQEYTNKQDQTFQQGLETKAKASDAQYLQEQAIPALQAIASKQGRSLDSSGVTNSALQFADRQNQERDRYIMGLSASQYGGRQEKAYQDYANMVQNQQGLVNSGINAQYQGIQNAQTRGQNIQDFNTQAQLYNQYLAKYGKRNNGVGQLVGGAIGTGFGAYFGGPRGASVGYQLGSGFGGAAQNSFGGY